MNSSSRYISALTHQPSTRKYNTYTGHVRHTQGTISRPSAYSQYDEITTLIQDVRLQESLNFRVMMVSYYKILEIHSCIAQALSGSTDDARVAGYRRNLPYIFSQFIWPALYRLRVAVPDHFTAFFLHVYRACQMYADIGDSMQGHWFDILGQLCFYRASLRILPDKISWSQTSHHCYATASLRHPTAGPLYLRLAQTADSPLRQLYFTMLFIASSPRNRSWGRILDIRSGNGSHSQFIRAHQLVHDKLSDPFICFAQEFVSSVKGYIQTETNVWKAKGLYIGIINMIGMLCAPCRRRKRVRRFTYDVLTVVLQRTDSETHQPYIYEQSIQPYMYVTLVFLHYLAVSEKQWLLKPAPWRSITRYLNAIKHDSELADREASFAEPLPEDYAIRAMDWAEWYRQKPWTLTVEDVQGPHLFEPNAVIDRRRSRILALGEWISFCSPWIKYDKEVGFIASEI